MGTHLKSLKSNLQIDLKMAAIIAKFQPVFLHHMRRNLRYLSVECAPPLNPATWGKAVAELGALAAKNPAKVTVGQAFLGEMVGKHWAKKTLPSPLFYATGLSHFGIMSDGTWCGYNPSKMVNGQRVFPNSKGEYQ